MSLLQRIQSPADLQGMTIEELTQVATEIRQMIISTCAENGGHVGPSLGVVELTLALHRSFHSPDDALIWDVGHQAYAHKILNVLVVEDIPLAVAAGLGAQLATPERPHGVALVRGAHQPAPLGVAELTLKVDPHSNNILIHLVEELRAVVGIIRVNPRFMEAAFGSVKAVELGRQRRQVLQIGHQPNTRKHVLAVVDDAVLARALGVARGLGVDRMAVLGVAAAITKVEKVEHRAILKPKIGVEGNNRYRSKIPALFHDLILAICGCVCSSKSKHW